MAEPRIARRMTGIAAFQVMELVARAQALEAEGRRIIHMEVGEPDFPTAGPIVEAGTKALAAGRTRYTAAGGIPELRQRIVAYYATQHGVDVPKERVVVTPGASGALQLATGVLINPGDEVLIADPSYPCNRHFVRYVDGVAVPIPVGPDTSYQLNADLVAEHWRERTAAVMLASPSNPTGTLVAQEDMDEIVAYVHERGGRVIVDEIYQGLVYAGRCRSALAVSDDVLVINSFSKYFGMTGWRLGWLVLPEDAVAAVTPLAQNLFISPSSIAQQAALAAFEPEAMAVHEERRAQFQERRDFLLDGLRSLGLSVPVVPDGAFYLYVDVSATGLDSHSFCWRLVEESQVAVTPGNDFGSLHADRYVRFAYTTGEEDIELGLERLGAALQRWRS